METIIEDLTGNAIDNMEEFSNKSFEDRLERLPDAAVVVAEGDSWFNYVPAWFENPLKGDLLGHLMATKKYNVYRISEAGDTLENMVYGTEYRKVNWTPKPPQIFETLAAIRRYRPKIFLFSGGGNDFAGKELEAYLNHADSGLNPVREDVVNYVFKTGTRKAYKDMIDLVRAEQPGIKIFLHGYGYAIPSGRAVIKITPGWQYIGPWLRPAFTAKRILKMTDMRRILNSLIDAFNGVLENIANENDDVYYIDLRPHIEDEDWANELHLDSKGWDKVAQVFDQRMSGVKP
jgi:lysophospholipase L1-like esterase